MKKSCVIIFILLLVCGVIGCFGHSQRMVSRKDESKTIRIAGFSSPRFLEEAARKFERKNPGLKVEIDAYASPEMLKQGDLLKMDEEYRSSLNTQLMSGKGADIIYVNGLPYKRYIDRHMFTDLHQLMKSDPNYDAGKYYTNIFDAVEIDDSLYTLPIDYCYDLLSSNIKMNLNDRSWNWQEFFDSAQNEIKGRDLYILPGSDEGLFHKIFWEDYSHFVNENSKTARFDSKEFVNLLKQCKGL